MIRAELLKARLARAELRWTSGPSKRVRRNPITYTLGNPGRPAKEPTLLIVIADDSGSVIGPTGADPVSNRYEEARRAFEAVVRRGGKHELGAVHHFDTPTSGDVSPVPLTSAGLKQLDAGLRVPPDARGCSNLGPSLKAGIELAEAHPEHRATLVILSDFQLFDVDMDQVLTDLAEFPGDVHAVVLGGTQVDGLMHERIQISHASYTDSPGTVARAVFASLTTHRPGSRPAPIPIASNNQQRRTNS
ncbi:hypothetical protein OG394_14175 [Kribbella sp. NBC_01245]|uniref:hypothetical protein n=1 Tax=Kribbella sp. NBC_01245 TaxID=2903578 RepID=UPI002E2E6471|nr:hypothetical protein [Kribbella sp. NBC_01245]